MTRRIRPARRSRATRRQESEFQVLMIWPLLAGGFWEPFLFCLGFLASRLVRFCSLFATTASLQVSSGNYAAMVRLAPGQWIVQLHSDELSRAGDPVFRLKQRIFVSEAP